MKKTLLVLFAVAFGMVSQAQFQAKNGVVTNRATKAVVNGVEWRHIGTPFTANTITGESVNLQAILSSGKYVVIDFSCTWCGPCWNFHQSGVLEAIQSQMGDSVQVIWVESESSNTTAQIYGPAGGSGYSSLTYGDWTVDADGNPVNYPIIDDDANSTCLRTCARLYEGYVPSIFLIAPSGYFCSLYGDGLYNFDTRVSVAQNLSILSNAINSAPSAGVLPAVAIEGPSTAVKGNQVTFAADIVSVDEVSSISWSATGASVASGSGETFTTSWNSAGDFTVTLTVTNTTGSKSATFQIHINEWNWGNTMTYMVDDNYVTSIGTGGSAFSWGVMFPAAFMAGRQYLQSVDIYVPVAGSYKMTIYKGGDNAPATQLYTRTVSFSSSEVGNDGIWRHIPMLDPVAIDQNQNLWVVFSTTNIDYPAAGCTFSGDYNGSMVGLNGNWYNIEYASGGDISVTWMIKATTGDSPVGIDGVSETKVSVYPNPATDMVKVEAEGLRQVEVLDVEGRSVLTSERPEVSLIGLASGVYMLRVVTENGATLQRIVKK